MYLSDRDLELALRTGQLIVNPLPATIDTTSIDLHLDKIEEAKVWDVDRFKASLGVSGNDAYLGVGGFQLKKISTEFAVPVPSLPAKGCNGKVYRDGNKIIVEPSGFFLWQTREEVGTPEIDPRYICFIDGKSTRARTGLIVHTTAPTIHAGWWGQVTLEIANLGPFTLMLKPGDAIAQIVVATISSPPAKKKISVGIDVGQKSVGGHAAGG